MEEGRALGAWLGIVGRGVVRAVMGEGGEREGIAEGDGGGGEEESIGDWNVVQNNGSF